MYSPLDAQGGRRVQARLSWSRVRKVDRRPSMIWHVRVGRGLSIGSRIRGGGDEVLLCFLCLATVTDVLVWQMTSVGREYVCTMKLPHSVSYYRIGAKHEIRNYISRVLRVKGDYVANIVYHTVDYVWCEC